MSDQELFTTFVSAPPARLIGVIREMLALPWQTGADSDAEEIIDGVEVMSSDTIDLHIVELSRSTSLEDDDGTREAVVRERSAPVVEGAVAALTAEWGEHQMLSDLEDPCVCTLLQLLMDSLGLVTVQAWQPDDRWILGCDQMGSEHAVLLFVASDHVVEDNRVRRLCNPPGSRRPVTPASSCSARRAARRGDWRTTRSTSCASLRSGMTS